jgi:excisionase family DNA binding protein
MTNATPSPTDPPYDAWLTKVEAAAAIGVTTKAIESLIKQRRVRYVPDYLRNHRRITLFHPADIADYAEKRRQRLTLPPVVLPAAATTGNGHREDQGLALTASSELQRRNVEEILAKMRGELAALALPPTLGQQTAPRAEVSDQLLLAKVFLTIREAARLTGLSEANIRRRCQSGSLKAIKDGGWKIRRARLQKL